MAHTHTEHGDKKARTRELNRPVNAPERKMDMQVDSMDAYGANPAPVDPLKDEDWEAFDSDDTEKALLASPERNKDWQETKKKTGIAEDRQNKDKAKDKDSGKGGCGCA